MSSRAYYSDLIENFLAKDPDAVIGRLSQGGVFAVEQSQVNAWRQEIQVLKTALAPYRQSGKVFFEFSVPRMGKRIDVVATIRSTVFVIEFKVGEKEFTASAHDQVWDYALDLKNFHETSHEALVAPILVATEAPTAPFTLGFEAHDDRLYCPIHTNAAGLGAAIEAVLADGPCATAAPANWEHGKYSPTPTIIEAAIALYEGHSVEDISRRDSEDSDLGATTDEILGIIRAAKAASRKSICFVTGVPGAGKTLVGLTVATRHSEARDRQHCVFLSGNGPLVTILREALARDKVRRDREHGGETTIGQARSRVKAFIQNVHHFRDDCLIDPGPPIEHVTIFDEAQRAWNRARTADFMRRKKKRPNFEHSEPEFLVSCMNRHRDWAVIVCLVGGGQEINTGEAGIGEWIDSILRSFPDWHIHISPQLRDSEYAAARVLENAEISAVVHTHKRLHLAVSMRSYRAEQVSAFVKALLDHEESEARRLHSAIVARYPIVLTRDIMKAKAWLRSRARGTERYGVVVSSNAQRLKPHAIDVRSPMNPVHWFLGPKCDVRSSYYLEDVATEFHVQGLELDWAGIVWDGDFRYSPSRWGNFCFKGKKWQHVKNEARQAYLKNAYRVLLTRARQGMAIVVPEGDESDPTRRADFYDPTFDYLKRIGLTVL